MSPFQCNVLSGCLCFGQDKTPGTAWLQHRAACSTGGWVLLPSTCSEGTPEHPGGDAASWVALCPSQLLTLQPGLPARGQPAPGGRTVMGTSLRPPATSVDNGSPPFRGRDRAARIRGHRELCLCLIQWPDVLDWKWQQGDCQKLRGGGDFIWEIVFLPADTFRLAVKNVSCP